MRNLLFFPLFVGLGATYAGATETTMLIDDFTSFDESALGTRWEGFTDRVMGGISDMQAGYAREGGDPVLRISGKVSLANNGGFIQIRLPLRSGGTLDASEYSGVAVEVRGTPGSYYVHLRTRANVLPWQYYDARLAVGEQWQRIEIPFEAFEPQSTRFRLDPGKLKTIAVAAAKAEFDADIMVRRIEFYR